MLDAAELAVQASKSTKDRMGIRTAADDPDFVWAAGIRGYIHEERRYQRHLTALGTEEINTGKHYLIHYSYSLLDRRAPLPLEVEFPVLPIGTV